MAVLYDEGRSCVLSQEGATITRTFRVEPYSSYPEVVARLLGTVVLDGTTLVRTPPASDPYIPAAFCREVKVEGVGVYGTTATGDPATMIAAQNGYECGARLVCTYKTLDYTENDSINMATGSVDTEVEITSESFDVSARQLTLPNDRYKWKGTTALLTNTNTGATKTIPQMTYELARHYVLRLPIEAITTLLGKINEQDFYVNDNKFPAECLRFDSCLIRRKVSYQGLKYYEVTYKLAVQPTYDKYKVDGSGIQSTGYVGWNRLFRPDTGQWEKPVLASDDSTTIYKLDTTVDQEIDGATVPGFDLLFHPKAS